MNYRKLNLVNGTDQDLEDFMRLLKAAFDKTPGTSSVLNLEILSKMVASGYLKAFVAEVNGEVVGVQTWERVPVWVNTKHYHMSKVHYLDPKVFSSFEHAMFAQFGAAQIREQFPEDIILFSVWAVDAEISAIPNCGFDAESIIYKAK